MIAVADLLALECLSDAEPSAPLDHGATRAVTDIAVLDVEPLTGDYSTFGPGCAVFTSLSFMNGDFAQADRALAELIRRGVAAVFVKDYFGYRPSKELDALARRRGVPIMAWQGSYLEVALSEARALLQAEEALDREEREVDALLGAGPAAVSRALQDLLGASARSLRVAAFRLDGSDRLAERAVRAQLQDAAGKASGEPASIVLRRQQGALLAFLTEGEAERDRAICFAEAALSASSPALRCGLGEALPSDQADLAIREALAALDRAAGERRLVTWDDLGLEAFRAAAQASQLMLRAAHAALRELRAYDAQTRADLESTLRAYVSCGGDAAETARRAHQHPNTVRNRLHRAASLLSCADMNDKELFAYLTLLFL